MSDVSEDWERELEEERDVVKALQVRRFWDPARRTLVYLVYSDKLIDGSPKNSISTVPIIKNWQR